MNREEKNQQTRRRILNSAAVEFAERGYGGSSINTIINRDGLSKGIVYHYFATKGDLYLACVEDCFVQLTGWLKERVVSDNITVQAALEGYFKARLVFFAEHPVYQRIFCEAVITPPQQLVTAIEQKRAGFDQLNIDILNRLLCMVQLREDIFIQEAVETFRQYQDFINARYSITGGTQVDMLAHEAACSRALDIFLYGIVSRKESM